MIEPLPLTLLLVQICKNLQEGSCRTTGRVHTFAASLDERSHCSCNICHLQTFFRSHRMTFTCRSISQSFGHLTLTNCPERTPLSSAQAIQGPRVLSIVSCRRSTWAQWFGKSWPALTTISVIAWSPFHAAKSSFSFSTPTSPSTS